MAAVPTSGTVSPKRSFMGAEPSGWVRWKAILCRTDANCHAAPIMDIGAPDRNWLTEGEVVEVQPAVPEAESS